MYFNLALKNIKRSLRDYTIYFLTLVFGICIFYTFNSIESQQVMMEINNYQKNGLEIVKNGITIVSILISFILGFLIIYANKYIIKRRKKEFGIYMTLGMRKKNISKILISETVIIGLISLIIGLIIGIFLSQGLSILTAKMFEAKLTNFTFIFSKTACIKTIFCFGIIYIIVLLFNSITIEKVNLIDLINASKKNEKLKIRNIWVSVFVFIISIVFLAKAYYMALNMDMAIIGKNTFTPFILGFIGTFLFFFSLTGFILKVCQKNKKTYLKDLNMFILRQINSKINTAFVSMSFICLMILFAICILSGGIGLSKGMNNQLKDLSQFDATIENTNGNQDIEEIFKENNLDINKYREDYVKCYLYDSNNRFSDFLSKDTKEEFSSFYPIATNQIIPAMKLSEFNNVMKMLGKEEISLKLNEYTVCNNQPRDFSSKLQEEMDKGTKITMKNIELLPAKNKILNVTINNGGLKNNFGIFIVNDSVLEKLKPIKSYINLTYKGDKELAEKEFSKERQVLKDNKDNTINVFSRERVLAESIGKGVAIAYIAIYIGTIFLITSAAILAIQQLSEGIDNVERYRLLKKIGVDNKMINKSIFTQVGIYFMMPMSLAIVHSIAGFKLTLKLVSSLGDENIMKYILIAVVILIIIYGGYFIATYNGVKKFLKTNS